MSLGRSYFISKPLFLVVNTRNFHSVKYWLAKIYCFFTFEILFLAVCVCESVCIYTPLMCSCPQRPEKGVECYHTRFIVIHEQPGLGAGSRAGILYKESRCTYLQSHLSTPSPLLLKHRNNFSSNHNYNQCALENKSELKKWPKSLGQQVINFK